MTMLSYRRALIMTRHTDRSEPPSVREVEVSSASAMRSLHFAAAPKSAPASVGMTIKT